LKAILLTQDERSIQAVGRIIRDGGIVAIPTDTVYGLACDPFNGRAVQRLFEVKGREAKPIPVLCHGQKDAESLVTLEPRALELARRYWPGALTIVAPLRVEMPPTLHQGTEWLGVRVPGSMTAVSAAAAAGGCVTGTSANLSGRPSCRTAQEVAAELGDRIDAIVDGGRLEAVESTVVRVVGGTVEVLRRGAIGFEQGIQQESHR
jgi:L-threonylcarbamoyladenylate synthase